MPPINYYPSHCTVLAILFLPVLIFFATPRRSESLSGALTESDHEQKLLKLSRARLARLPTPSIPPLFPARR
jgi:hypothetical protein